MQNGTMPTAYALISIHTLDRFAGELRGNITEIKMNETVVK